MSSYLFASGYGHFSARAEKAASAAGATLNNHTEPGCSCGRGHTDGCPSQKRHWFVGPNYGPPFDQELAARVLAAVRQVATEADQKILLQHGPRTAEGAGRFLRSKNHALEK